MGWEASPPLDESFVGANGTELSSHDGNWTQLSGAPNVMEIQDNKCVSDATGDELVAYRYLNTTCGPAIGIPLEFIDKSQDSVPMAWLWDSSGNGYGIYYNQDTDLLSVAQSDAYVFSLLRSVASGIAVGETPEIILLVGDGWQRIYVGGVLKLQTTDSTHTYTDLTIPALVYANDANTGEGQIFTAVRSGDWTPPTELPAAVIAFLDDLPCEGGNLIARVPTWVRIEIERNQNGRHLALLTAPRSASWVGDITRGCCLHTRLHNGLVFDWRVQNMEDGLGPSKEPVVRVQCDPVDIDMIDCGPIKSVTSGGLTSYQTEYTNRTPTQIVDDIIIPALQAYGYNYISKGTIDPTSTHTGSHDLITPRELLKILEEETGAFARLRADGLTGYYLDLVDSLAPSTDVARARAGVNLREITRRRDAEDLATVIMVRGMSQGVLRAPIGMARWEVTAISTGATDRLTLADPEGGPGPIGEDDQFVANSLGSGDPTNIPPHYVVFPDGTTSKITDSDEGDQYVWIVDSTGLSAGDLVQIACDSDGTLLQEVHSPDGLAAYGRICRYFDLDEEPGFDNLALNGAAGTWTDKPSSGVGVADGAQSNPSGDLDIKEGTPGFVIDDDAWVMYFHTSTPTRTRFAKVSSGDTLDASGDGTITCDYMGIPTNSVLVFYNLGDGDHFPDDWNDAAPGGTYNQFTPVLHRPADQDTDQMVGTIQDTYGSNQGMIIEGLTPGDEIYAGDVIIIGATGETFTVINNDTVQADGTARVIFNLDSDYVIAVSGLVGINKITPPTIHGGDGWVWMLSTSELGFAYAGALKSDLVKARYLKGLDTVWASAAFWVTNNDTTHTPLEVAASGGDVEPMEVAIYDGTSELANEAAADFDLDYLASATKIIRTSHILTEDDELAVIARGVKCPITTGWRDNPTTFLLWFEMRLTDGTEPTDLEPAYSNAGVRLHQAANRALIGRKSWDSSVTVTARELAEFWNLAGASEVKLDLGQVVRVTEPALEIDEEWVVTKIKWLAHDPENPAYELGKRRKDYTERVVEALKEARG